MTILKDGVLTRRYRVETKTPSGWLVVQSYSNADDAADDVLHRSHDKQTTRVWDTELETSAYPVRTPHGFVWTSLPPKEQDIETATLISHNVWDEYDSRNVGQIITYDHILSMLMEAAQRGIQHGRETS